MSTCMFFRKFSRSKQRKQLHEIKHTGCIKLLFEQHISIEIAQFQRRCLLVISAHLHFFFNVEIVYVHGCQVICNIFMIKMNC